MSGGGRGIRTPVTIPREAVFKTAAFNHSAIPPPVKGIIILSHLPCLDNRRKITVLKIEGQPLLNTLKISP